RYDDEVMLAAKLAVARAVGAAARAVNRGGGTSLPGKLLMRLEPDALALLARRLPRGSAVISATNGKTTTAAMMASILERADVGVVHNHAGANMAGGVASALLAAARPRGAIDGELGLFEVDEFWLERVVEDVDPRVLVLANLFRDQLDRYGELETIADRWARLVAGRPAGGALILNADDPLVADLGRERSDTRYFGVDDDGVALPELQHAADSKHCRRCGHAYAYEAVYLAHLGRYRCPNCGQRRTDLDICARAVELHGVRESRFELHTDVGSASVTLPLPGLYNIYNALAAAAACLELGVGLDGVVAGLEQVSPAFGRAETVDFEGRSLSILLIKNPAGANEVLRTLALEPPRLDLLAVLNDNVADGRDISWVWDADFELIADRVARVTCSGTRAGELALRLRYAGVTPDRLTVVPALADALELAAARADGPLYALPTYTALLELRQLLARSGHTGRYWC
ncbi:MAG TPA: MurT ligase domain-containing protein, partial [Solirubrobacteraceae bacterium]|nr:MurT ligase domain-containing protein [Solirubrobacteraceae bacterium]